MYKVRIDKFEGPFDLLVYLLENAKMDIYDIRVGEITEQYIDYLKQMEDLDIEVDSDFIVLAAVLIWLKSHMLLPRISEDGERIIEEDPRQNLTNRLLEYVRIKNIAADLQKLEEINLSIYEKPAEDMSVYMDNPDKILIASEEQLVKAFMIFLTGKKKVRDVVNIYHRPRNNKESVEDRIKYMTSRLDEKLKIGKGNVLFTELLPNNPDRYDYAISFISLLSMIKNRECDALQDKNFGDIKIIKNKLNEEESDV